MFHTGSGKLWARECVSGKQEDVQKHQGLAALGSPHAPPRVLGLRLALSFVRGWPGAQPQEVSKCFL